ncbi:CoA ester lyase [Streptomyces sp. NBC_00659]|uniref:HpcH/HpaI aldolase/citrate lyase family protein n=1 Tax=Streptomyces sp. NBC_00659 TaxID=2903669 RepID=UPI002E374138|nr:CoA ester lyase [Streptomyces sp. NBC_00659]
MTGPTPSHRVPRSYLYVPGDRPRMLAKALGRGADALIVDLEDAVAPAARRSALRAVRTWLEALPPDGATSVWVRVNPGPDGLREAAALVCPALRGLCLAKCPHPGAVSAFHDVLTEREAKLGLTVGRIALSPLLETAAAVLNAPALAAAPRVAHLQAGEADLCAELGMEPSSDDRSELLVVRTTLVLASAAAGIAPPVGPVSTVFRDTQALLASTRALRRLGYRSRACIHPDQIPVVHEVFTPSAEEVSAARALVDRFEEAARSGLAVVTGADGRMVDEAVVRAARRVLAAAPEHTA